MDACRHVCLIGPVKAGLHVLISLCGTVINSCWIITCGGLDTLLLQPCGSSEILAWMPRAPQARKM